LPRLSFYPRLTFGGEWLRDSGRVEAAPQRTDSPETPASEYSLIRAGPGVDGFAPFLFHLSPGFFVGAGPHVEHHFVQAVHGDDLYGPSTALDVHVILGATWGGQPAPAEPDEGEACVEPPEPRRFGDPGVWAFTAETAASARSWTYTRGDASSFEILFTPGFDYFVAKHYSLGAAANILHLYDVAPQRDKTTVRTELLGVGGVARFGADLPVSARLSFYPRAGFLVTYIDVSREYRGVKTYFGTNRVDESAPLAISFSLYAPHPFHFGSRGFAGFGPFLLRDLSRKSGDGRGDEDRATDLGLRASIGGWL
jgi:hypothetical protein